MTLTVLSIKQISEATGLSPVTIWRKEIAGEFPVRRQLGSRRVGWLNRELMNGLRPHQSLRSPRQSILN